MEVIFTFRFFKFIHACVIFLLRTLLREYQGNREIQHKSNSKFQAFLVEYRQLSSTELGNLQSNLQDRCTNAGGRMASTTSFTQLLPIPALSFSLPHLIRPLLLGTPAKPAFWFFSWSSSSGCFMSTLLSPLKNNFMSPFLPILGPLGHGGLIHKNPHTLTNIITLFAF